LGDAIGKLKKNRGRKNSKSSSISKSSKTAINSHLDEESKVEVIDFNDDDQSFAKINTSSTKL
jgi:hypothetical protein